MTQTQKTAGTTIIEAPQCEHPNCDREPEDVVKGRELCASHASAALQKEDRC